MAALQSAVQAYKQEEELAGNIGVKSVKRRREPAQVPMVMIICLPDKAHMSGSQYPLFAARNPAYSSLYLTVCVHFCRGTVFYWNPIFLLNSKIQSQLLAMRTVAGQPCKYRPACIKPHKDEGGSVSICC